jgi:hypothetical protein
MMRGNEPTMQTFVGKFCQSAGRVHENPKGEIGLVMVEEQ